MHEPLKAFVAEAAVGRSARFESSQGTRRIHHMHEPDLSEHINKRLALCLSHSRKVVGVLKGYDAFMNIVLEAATDETNADAPTRLGTTVVRGVSIISVVT